MTLVCRIIHRTTTQRLHQFHLSKPAMQLVRGIFAMVVLLLIGSVTYSAASCLTPPTSCLTPPTECGENAVYSECGTACPLTCAKPEVVACTKQCLKGCFCKEGYVLNDQNECILRCQCPRTYNKY
uniref:TIL domain-containing protein n=1 Tax=Anopheles farauti TaxID=69004 RepID=A0A182Q170_9DIPT